MRTNKLAKWLQLFSVITFLLVNQFVYSLSPLTQTYTEVEWIQLMPEDDLDALLTPPDMLGEIQDGSEQDSVSALSSMIGDDAIARRFEQALTSTRVIDSFDNMPIRIPGFMVPLKSDEQQRVVEFFIVPYFGACLHMPPPPPNQMIYGKVVDGFELSQLSEPYWFEGVVTIQTTSNMTGTSAYGMTLDSIRVYE